MSSFYVVGHKSIFIICITKHFLRQHILPIRILWCVFIIGSIAVLRFVWELADTRSSLMASPNLIVLLTRSPIVVKLTMEYLIS